MNMTAAGTAVGAVAGGGRAGHQEEREERKAGEARTSAGWIEIWGARTAGPGMGLGWGGCGLVGGWSLLVAGGREGRRRHTLGGAPRAQGRAGRRKEPVRPARARMGHPREAGGATRSG